LIVLTDKYPYGVGETFIEPERKQWNRFDQVFICPVLAKEDDKIRTKFIPESNETVIKTFDSKPGMSDIMRSFFGPFTLSEMVDEIKTRKDIALVSRSKLVLALTVYTNLRVQRIYEAISKEIGNTDSSNKALIYSYWMFEPALVAIGLKRKLKYGRAISRAHGYDVYKERHINSYIPFRKNVFEEIESIYSISESGRNYLCSEFNGQYVSKIELSRLGTEKKYPDYNEINESRGITIVSCAYLVPLKRVHLIAEALKLSTKDVTWIHFGDGDLLEDLKKKVKELPSNIKVFLMGSVYNEEIQKFYSTHYIDAFINVSETEGIPVSIMEAQSYGIPVIATDVGGTSELVVNGENGILLAKDFNAGDLLVALDTVIANGNKFRKHAKTTWLEKSSAEKNYREFFDCEIERLNG